MHSRLIDRQMGASRVLLAAAVALALLAIPVSRQQPGKVAGAGVSDVESVATTQPAVEETTPEPVTSPPNAKSDDAETLEDTLVRIDVSANDTDPDGDLAPETASVDCDECSGPAGGTAKSVGDGTITYEPSTGFTGVDQFFYRICDDAGQCSGALVSVTVVAVPKGPLDPSEMPDAFTEASYWNTPIPDDAAIHPDSQRIIEFLREDNAENGCILLSGYAGNKWGMPAYAAGTIDPVYNVESRKYDLPPEFSFLRIPLGALPADSSDGEMVVYDLVSNVVALFSKAVYDADTDTWTVNGGSIAHLDSNGLDGSLPESDDARNGGTFRGYPGAVAMIHWDDVVDGRVDNVVKIGVNNAHEDFVFPMVGSDGDTDHPDAPVEGIRIRVKPDVDLEALGLTGQALVIARGLQEYGMVVADNTGGGIELKLEDTERSGRGTFWDLEREALCGITTEHLEVLATR